MTRLVRIQNMQPAESLQPLIAALHSVAGTPTEFKIDPQREVFIAIHDNAPMISIGKQPIAESDLPSDTVLATARSAAGLQEQLDSMRAENQQLRVDKDALAADVERLTTLAAEHKPAEDSELSAQLAQAQADNKVLADAYEKRFEELKAAEVKLAELSELVARDEMPNVAAAEAKLAEMTADRDALATQLADLKALSANATKDEIKDAIDAAQPATAPEA